MFSFIQIVFAFTFPFSAFRFNLSALTALRAIETASFALHSLNRSFNRTSCD